MDNRTALIAKIVAQYDAGIDIPLVSLEDFFGGNSDGSSIAPNMVDYGHPGLKRFQEILTAIRERPDVDCVLMGIHECPEPDDPRDAKMWPMAENVYIYTSANTDDVESWTAELRTDGAVEGWPYGQPTNAPECRPGYKVFALCWD
jgi:hypothetical protein